MNEAPNLPPWIERLIRKLCGDYWLEGIQGDLEEKFKERSVRLGQRRAKLWLYLELVALFRFVFYRKEKSSYIKSNIMFWNHLKVTLRSFRRNKAYTLLNILGLTSGLVVFIMITLFVNHEFSYDQYHQNKDRVYRIYKNVPRGDQMDDIKLAQTPVPLAPILKTDFPEVTYASRIGGGRTETFIRVNGQTFLEPEVHYTDPETFKMFSFEVMEGDGSQLLTEKHTVVLSASMALKYFGRTDVLGEVIYYDKEHPMQVAGVIKDIPANSHLTMDIILQYETIMGIMNDSPTNWRLRTYTYVMLEENANHESFQAKILELEGRHYNGPGDQDRPITYHLQSLGEVHFGQDIRSEPTPTANTTLLYVYLGIAIMILIIAGINYINLATARAIKRTQEIGIRKVVGAQSKNLIFQFLTESFLFVFISLLISLLCVLLILPAFSQFVEKELVLDFSDFTLWLFLGGLCLGLSLLAGIYPALLLTSFKPVSALKGKAQNTKGTILRNILVIFQFTISSALILGTLVVSKQLNYIQNMDVGYTRDQIVVLSVRDKNVREQLSAFTQEISDIPAVVNMAFSNSFIGQYSAQGNIRFPGMENSLQLMVERAGYDYIDLYGLELVKGRNFSREIESDKGAYLLNESAIKAIGWEEPFDEQMGAAKIIGIVKDFHQHSLHEKIKPVLFYLDDGLSNRPRSAERISIKIAGDDLQATVATIEAKYNSFNPEYPFEYQYFEDVFNRAYLAEIRTSQLVNWFAGLTILVACLGLYGLASYKVEQRIKEVGIRKVLGASIPKILTLLSKDFVKLLVIAFLIAAPVAFYLMDNWLDNFAYHVSIGALSFVLTLVMMILIAGLAVGHRTYKAAVRNPVESLRDE